MPPTTARPRGRGGPGFAELFAVRRNGYGLLRLLFALGVVLAHTLALGGFHGGRGLSVVGSGADPSVLCVDGFFVLSGMLITRSAERTGVGRYLWHRVLRIFPGFWLALLVTGLVAGPAAYLADHGTLRGLFGTSDSPLRYLAADAALTMHRYGVAGTPSGVPYPRVWAGSLYTLVYEFRCYLLVALLAALGVLRRRTAARVVVTTGAAAIWAYNALAVAGATDIRIPGFQTASARGFLLSFALGAVANVWRERVPMASGPAVVAAVLAALALTTSPVGWVLVGLPCSAYLLLWVGLHLPARLTRVNRGRDGTPDLSYGIYTLGFPAQQVLALLGLAAAGWAAFTAASLLAAAALGAASWYGVERRALALRDLQLPPRLVGRRLDAPVRHRSRTAPTGPGAPPAGPPRWSAPRPPDPRRSARRGR